MQKHIIMIEDDADILEATGMMLEIAGYRFSGFSAFKNYEELAALHSDCFLLDENLPGMSGHIICMMLKSKKPTQGIPVILVSANAKLDDLAKLSEADATIKKPFDINSLLSTIAMVLR